MIKLTPKKTRQLAIFLERQLEEHNYSNDLPIWETINYWLADWTREQMKIEADQYHDKTIDTSSMLK